MSSEVTIDDYRLVNLLQQGQNSQVYEVTDGTKRFIMKLLLPDKAHDSDQRKMLFHEAQVAMKLQHPKIIRVFSYSKNKENPYLLMEYFPSLNLKLRLMKKGQYESFVRPNLRSIIEQAATALQYMHDQKWVHRDIKPDNLLVSGGGDVRLIDFALAVRPASTFSRMFAKPGKTAGTRSYMSPEQIRGLPLDNRADIYSFGVMLYEIVAGRLPFVAQSSDELFRKHLSAPPPPIESQRGVTKEFEVLIGTLMAKKEPNRPKNLNDFLADLRGIKIYLDEAPAAAVNHNGY